MSRDHSSIIVQSGPTICPFESCSFHLDQAILSKMIKHIQHQHQLVFKLKYLFIILLTFSCFFKYEKVLLEDNGRSNSGCLAQKRKRALDSSSSSTKDGLRPSKRNNEFSYTDYYVCSYCNYRSTSPSKVRDHEFRLHSDERSEHQEAAAKVKATLKRLKCSVDACVEQFGKMDTLYKHLFEVHQIAQFMCNVENCSQGFATKYV